MMKTALFCRAASKAESVGDSCSLLLAHSLATYRPTRKFAMLPSIQPTFMMIAPGKIPNSIPAAKFKGVVVIT
eukprot:760043-Hanusia_phi.AAC.2